jgi:hypothetical protein
MGLIGLMSPMGPEKPCRKKRHLPAKEPGCGSDGEIRKVSIHGFDPVVSCLFRLYFVPL